MKLKLWQIVLSCFFIEGQTCTQLNCMQLTALNPLQGLANGQPTLRPGTDYYCPNVTNVTYTCYGSQVSTIEWIQEGYGQFVLYAIDLGLELYQGIGQDEYLSAILINITNVNGSLGDMITELTVDTHGLKNATNLYHVQDI